MGTHFTQGFLANQFSDRLQTLSTGYVTVNVTETYAMVNNIKITYPDINASNGVVHGMDTVLLPHKRQYGTWRRMEMFSKSRRIVMSRYAWTCLIA